MRTATQAARAFKNQSRNELGMCLKEVQDVYQVPVNMFPSAKSQWENAKHKHPGDRTPPVGAPVYFKGGQWWHIAIYLGGGMVRSTDAGGRNIMATVPLDWFKTHWGYSYLGWSEDLANQRIDFDHRYVVYPSQLKPGVNDSESVRVLRWTLAKRGYLKLCEPLSLDRPGNKYTNAVTQGIRLWQKKKGHRATGVLTKQQAVEYFAPNDRIKVIV